MQNPNENHTKATGVKGKGLFMPTRVAITGSAHGPEMVNTIYLLGKEKIISRINKVLDSLLKDN